MNYYRTKANPLARVSQPLYLDNPDGTRTFRSKHGMFTDAQMLAAGYYREVTPSYDQATERLGSVPGWDEDAGTVTINVVPMEPEELAIISANNINAIAAAARAYIAEQIDPDGMLLVERMVRAGHPYGVESERWLLAVRLEQYRRMAVVEAGAEDFSDAMLDFSGFGDKPYTVQQMMMVAGIGG